MQRLMFRRSATPSAYSVWVGNALIGTVHKEGRVWMAKYDGRPIGGGASRTYAAHKVVAAYLREHGAHSLEDTG